jgi:hypothetical protein
MSKPRESPAKTHPAVENLFTREALVTFAGKLGDQAMHRVAMNAIATIERARVAIDEGRRADLDAHALVSEHSPFASFASDRLFRDKVFLLRERWLEGIPAGAQPSELQSLGKEIQVRFTAFKASIATAFATDGVPLV